MIVRFIQDVHFHWTLYKDVAIDALPPVGAIVFFKEFETNVASIELWVYEDRPQYHILLVGYGDEEAEDIAKTTIDNFIKQGWTLDPDTPLLT